MIVFIIITPHVDYMHTLAIAVRHNISNNIIIYNQLMCVAIWYQNKYQNHSCSLCTFAVLGIFIGQEIQVVKLFIATKGL